MEYIVFGMLFVFGLVVGSFLNVLSLRYSSTSGLKREKVIKGRSYCPHCKKTLSWYELIPLVSFVLQRGKCRSCTGRLSLQYPIVELLTGILFVVVPLSLYKSFGVGFLLPEIGIPIWFYAFTGVWLIAATIFVFLSIVDLRLMIIPDGSNIVLALLGILGIVIKSQYELFGTLEGSFIGHYASIFGLRESIVINHISAALFGLIFFGLIVVLSRGRGMGLGDVKLAVAAGVLLGWPDIVLALLLSFVVGALVGIYLLLRRKKTFKQGIPFGPFIVIGIFLTLFFGTQIMKGYFALFPV